MITNAVESQRVSGQAAATRSSEIARTVATTLLGLYLISTLLVPAAIVNKLIFVFLFGLMALAPSATGGRARIRTLSPIIILGVFLYGFVLAQVGETFPALTNQLMLSVAVLLLIYVVDWYAIDLEYLIMLSSLVLCLFTAFALYAVTVVPDSALGAYFIDYFLDYSLGAVAQRSFTGGAGFAFRIGPVPFLFLPYCLFLIRFLETKRVRYLGALIVVSAVILLSTSRALILGCLIVAAYLVIRRMRPASQVIMLCVGAVLGVLFLGFLITQTTVFSPTETSNSIKMGHVVSFVDHMTPARLLFGEGLAATYFSIGYNTVEPQTEITLLDMVRFVGMPLTALLYASLLFPVPRRSCYTGENQTAVFIFGLYVVIALTNPVLFNSFGLIIVIWYWSRILGTSEHRIRA